ncbi:MAG: asparagine synthase (glutamine-hydrolyzing) [Flavobacteriales bacterium]|nr:asparagine synthase (glutamine-hydrolyzing) [Flavobacteriales bacterium]
MCGISGIFGIEGLPDPEAVAGTMNDAMAHRGPDAAGVWRGSNVVLGHRRLGIIDLGPASDQPFHDPDGRYVMVFNGEIYNYRSLRAELERTVTFRTNSDTEVLLHAFIAWGAECLGRLEGMFSFAVWDAEKEELFLARDRFGIKPLYLFRNDKHVLFASEVRAVLASGLVPRRIDPEGLVDLLRYQTVRAPRTIVRDVTMLKAGHWQRISDQEIQEERWYDPVAAALTHGEPGPLSRVHSEVRERLGKAVEKRLVADVPFGAFLSGGIDSSAVVGLMAQASTSPVHTFSVVFEEEEFSEERYARIIAKKFSTRHTAIRLRPSDMLQELPNALAAMDHPSADGPNTYVVSKVTKAAGITMALSGLGGDEIFAGYPVFTRTLALWQRRWITQFPLGIRVVLAKLIQASKPGVSSAKLGELLRLGAFSVDDTFPISRLVRTDRELVEMLQQDTLPRNAVAVEMERMVRHDNGHTLPLLSQVSLGELGTYLQDILLRDTDQMSMAHALEVRVPFLDHDLVDYVLAVKDVDKYPHQPKKLLVDSLGDLLPREVVDRPKMGFTLPWELWMREDLRDFCADRLERLGKRSMFRSGTIDAQWRRFLDRDPRVNWARLWSLVVLEDWIERHGLED